MISISNNTNEYRIHCSINYPLNGIICICHVRVHCIVRFLGLFVSIYNKFRINTHHIHHPRNHPLCFRFILMVYRNELRLFEFISAYSTVYSLHNVRIMFQRCVQQRARSEYVVIKNISITVSLEPLSALKTESVFNVANLQIIILLSKSIFIKLLHGLLMDVA